MAPKRLGATATVALESLTVKIFLILVSMFLGIHPFALFAAFCAMLLCVIYLWRWHCYALEVEAREKTNVRRN